MLMVWASTAPTPHDNCHWLTTCWLSPLQPRNGWVMETEFPFTLAASQALWGPDLTTEEESQHCFFWHCESLINQNSSASTDLISRQRFSWVLSEQFHTKRTISNSAGHIILRRKLILCYLRPEKNVSCLLEALSEDKCLGAAVFKYWFSFLMIFCHRVWLHFSNL